MKISPETPKDLAVNISPEIFEPVLAKALGVSTLSKTRLVWSHCDGDISTGYYTANLFEIRKAHSANSYLKVYDNHSEHLHSMKQADEFRKYLLEQLSIEDEWLSSLISKGYRCWGIFVDDDGEFGYKLSSREFQNGEVAVGSPGSYGSYVLTLSRNIW